MFDAFLSALIPKESNENIFDDQLAQLFEVPTFSFSSSSSCKCYLLKAMTWSASKDKQGGTCTFGWNRTKIPLPYKMQLMNIEVRFLTCIQKTAFKFQSLTYYIYIYIYIIHLYSNIHVGT